MRVYLSRWVCLGVESNLLRLRAEAVAAAEAGADWVIFPESFLTGYTRAVAPALARAAFSEISAGHARASFFFGSFTEERRNRMTVWRGGREIARYDKVHLFEPNGESRLWDPGDRYAAVDLDGVRTGLLNCNDLRFPEQARALKLKAEVSVFVAVAWWPWRRTHVWETLLRARAIENGAWVFGCCVAGSEVPDEAFAGAGNYAFDPHGEPVRTLDDHTYEVDMASPPELVVDPVRSFQEVTKLDIFPGVLGASEVAPIT
jgi:predicted amidohydrolase